MQSPASLPDSLGLIAGNGKLPFLVLEEAVRKKVRVVVAAIKEETEPELEDHARKLGDRVSIHWLGVGQLGKLIRLFKRKNVQVAVMVGQVRHHRIFARGSRSPLSRLKHLPDLKMLKALATLPSKNTSSLVEGLIGILEREGIHFIDSTLFLSDLLPGEGVLSRRPPTSEEQKDFEFGRPIAQKLAGMDIGQTIVVKDQAVVAVEAMEGTDATIRRAGELAAGEELTVIKVSRPQQDMRFDVPVIGAETVSVLIDSRVSAMAIDAGRTLVLDRVRVMEELDRVGIALVAFPPEN